MSIMPPHREHPLSTSRLIASCVLRVLDDGDRGHDDDRRAAFNSLFRLATAMQSHRFYGMREPDYAELARILDVCVIESCGSSADEGYDRLVEALRMVVKREGSAQDEAAVRTMAEAMARQLENA